jgi:hypothetical protein
MDPANRGKSRDGRFQEKVFLPEEREFIRSSADPDEALWSLWAVKEAAWKAAVKAAPEDGRGWKGIRVRTESSGAGSGCEAIAGPVPPDGDTGGEPPWKRIMTGMAETFAGCAAFQVHRRGACIHALCRLGPEDPALRIIWNSQAVSSNKVSDLFLHCTNKSDTFSARGDLICRVKALMGLGEGDVAIRRDPGPRGLLPPHLYIRGEPSRIDVSLSHDGRFTAWALLFALSCIRDPAKA